MLSKAVRFLAASLVLSLAGCHSIRFGPMLATPRHDGTPPLRAWLGAPILVAEPPVLPGDAVLPAQYLPPGPDAAGAPMPIDLPSALALAGVENPTIALADEAVRARLAERMQARALLFPTLDAGANYRFHHGPLLSGRGVVIEPTLQSLYYGFGADTKGGGAVAVPGIRLVAHLGDAFAAPHAAQQRVIEGRLDAAATRHAVLGDVGLRYLALVDAHARALALRQTLKEVEEIERLTQNHAKAGQGREADYQRAQSEALLLRGQLERADEESAVAAAELARWLNLDPAARLRPADPTPPLVELVDVQTPLESLLAIALESHPEIAARDATVAFHEIRLRQERVRPWLPVVAVGFSAGEFGGSGSNTVARLGEYSPRVDLDVAAVWTLQNFGAANRALTNGARAGLEMAWTERARVIDRIRREVADAHAVTLARRSEVDLARKRLEMSERALQQEMTRIRNLKGLPLEALRSVNQVADARIDLVRAMIGYSQSQLQLYVALGQRP